MVSGKMVTTKPDVGVCNKGIWGVIQGNPYVYHLFNIILGPGSVIGEHVTLALCQRGSSPTCVHNK